MDQNLTKHERKLSPDDWRRKSHGHEDGDGSKGRCPDRLLAYIKLVVTLLNGDILRIIFYDILQIAKM